VRPLVVLCATLVACRTPTKSDPEERRPPPIVVEVADVAEEPTAPSDACVSTNERLRLSGRLTGVLPHTPAIDLDGDGKFDPIYQTMGSPEILVYLFVEKGGCARELGAIGYAVSGSLDVVGRDKQGWAILHGRGPHYEESAEYDGARYVTKRRKNE
jgi:hypothetical protein